MIGVVLHFNGKKRLRKWPIDQLQTATIEEVMIGAFKILKEHKFHVEYCMGKDRYWFEDSEDFSIARHLVGEGAKVNLYVVSTGKIEKEKPKPPPSTTRETITMDSMLVSPQSHTPSEKTSQPTTPGSAKSTSSQIIKKESAQGSIILNSNKNEPGVVKTPETQKQPQSSTSSPAVRQVGLNDPNNPFANPNYGKRSKNAPFPNKKVQQMLSRPPQDPEYTAKLDRIWTAGLNILQGEDEPMTAFELKQKFPGHGPRLLDLQYLLEKHVRDSKTVKRHVNEYGQVSWTSENKAYEKSKGFAMLKKMGWSKGTGLGTKSQGIVNPVKATKKASFGEEYWNNPFRGKHQKNSQLTFVSKGFLNPKSLLTADTVMQDGKKSKGLVVTIKPKEEKKPKKEEEPPSIPVKVIEKKVEKPQPVKHTVKLIKGFPKPKKNPLTPRNEKPSKKNSREKERHRDDDRWRSVSDKDIRKLTNKEKRKPEKSKDRSRRRSRSRSRDRPREKRSKHSKESSSHRKEKKRSRRRD